MQTAAIIKQGSNLNIHVKIVDSNGDPIGHSAAELTSQIKTIKHEAIDAFEISDFAAGEYLLTVVDTTGWPIGTLLFDIKIEPADGGQIYTGTYVIKVLNPVTDQSAEPTNLADPFTWLVEIQTSESSFDTLNVGYIQGPRGIGIPVLGADGQIIVFDSNEVSGTKAIELIAAIVQYNSTDNVVLTASEVNAALIEIDTHLESLISSSGNLQEQILAMATQAIYANRKSGIPNTQVPLFEYFADLVTNFDPPNIIGDRLSFQTNNIIKANNLDNQSDWVLEMSFLLQCLHNGGAQSSTMVIKVYVNDVPDTVGAELIKEVNLTLSKQNPIGSPNAVVNYSVPAASNKYILFSIQQTADFIAVTDASYSISNLGNRAVSYGPIMSPEPDDPAIGASKIWICDGTGPGELGDVMIKINVNGVTKTTTLVDYSAI